MGITLLIVGWLWVGLGLLNFTDVPVGDDVVTGWFAITNFLLFIFPGLILAGFGSMLRKRDKEVS